MLSVATAFSASQAALLTYNATGNVDTDSGYTFTFNKFNPGLGTLSSIDLLINYSTPTGSATVTNNSPTNNVTIRNIKSSLDIFDDAGLGFGGYFGSDLNLNTTPTAKQPTNFVLSPSNSRAFSINSSQSLIGGTQQVSSISGGSFASYLGSGSVSFFAVSAIDLTTIGSSYAVNSSAYYANTSLSLQYTYTPAPSGVPEPSQIAASLLVVAGLGIYFLRRRKAAELSH